jgi:Coenzyme PQQ synthesis protein D (PqqD)
MKNTPISRQSNLVVQELEKELLVYDLSTNKAYCLNETSALVYQLSDGKRTVQEISDLMSAKLNTLVSEDFVWLALNELKRDGLIENADEMKVYFAGINRREVVKKIGFASMIALPIVSSVVAPNAAMASSLPAAPTVFNACSTNTDCGTDAPYCIRVDFGLQAGTNVCCVGPFSRSGTGDVIRSRSLNSCEVCLANRNSRCCSQQITSSSCAFDPSVGDYECSVTCA